MSNEESIARFYEQSESASYRDVIYPEVQLLLKSVNGNMPVVVFMDNGVVVYEYGLRNMDEGEIKAFFAQE